MSSIDDLFGGDGNKSHEELLEEYKNYAKLSVEVVSATLDMMEDEDVAEKSAKFIRTFFDCLMDQGFGAEDAMKIVLNKAGDIFQSVK